MQRSLPDLDRRNGLHHRRLSRLDLGLPTIGPKAFLRLAQVNLGLVILNIVTGAAVRLTDSGLGCPNWPDCSQHHLTPALSFHPAVEFANRMVVVVLCVGAALAVLGALRRSPFRRDLLVLSGGLVLGIFGEALLGAIVVYSKLNPYVVMTHFMVGMALLTVALALTFRAGRSPKRGPLKVTRSVLGLSRASAGILVVAIVAGTATTAAGPHAGGVGAKRLPVPLDDMTRTHSGIILCLGVLVLALLYMLDRTKAPESVQLRGRLLLGAMVVQGLIGYTQYFTHLPAGLVEVHVLGATLVWSAMVYFVDGQWHHYPEEVTAEDGDLSSATDDSSSQDGSSPIRPTGTSVREVLA